MGRKKEKEVERDDIKIDGNVATWAMRMEGDIKGTYTGVFKFRCFLLPSQRIRANARYREMLGANPTLAGEHESALAYALTQLEHRILESPPFWTTTLQESGVSGDLEDDNIIMAVLDTAIAAELKYRKSLTKRKDEAIARAKKAADKLLEERKVEEEQDEEVEEEQNEK